MLIIQDDAVPCPGLADALPLLVAARPERVLCLWHGSRPRRSVIRMMQAAERCESWSVVQDEDWLPLVATVWPAPLARAFYADSLLPGFRARIADDEVAGLWLSHHGQYALASVPSLVQHPDDVPGLISRRRNPSPRTAACFIGSYDALSIDWTTGAE